MRQLNVQQTAGYVRILLRNHFTRAVQRGFFRTQRFGAGDLLKLIGHHRDSDSALARSALCHAVQHIVQGLGHSQQAVKPALQNLVRGTRRGLGIEAPQVVNTSNRSDLGFDFAQQRGKVFPAAGAYRVMTRGQAGEAIARLDLHQRRGPVLPMLEQTLAGAGGIGQHHQHRTGSRRRSQHRLVQNRLL